MGVEDEVARHGERLMDRVVEIEVVQLQQSRRSRMTDERVTVPAAVVDGAEVQMLRLAHLLIGARFVHRKAPQLEVREKLNRRVPGWCTVLPLAVGMARRDDDDIADRQPGERIGFGCHSRKLALRATNGRLR
jgi:hypothetical protein